MSKIYNSNTQSINLTLNSIPKENFKTFENYIERLKICVKIKGDYFEHLIFFAILKILSILNCKNFWDTPSTISLV